jgi:hypothetical protein
MKPPSGRLVPRFLWNRPQPDVEPRLYRVQWRDPQTLRWNTMPVNFPTEAAARAAFPRSLDCRVVRWNAAPRP